MSSENSESSPGKEAPEVQERDAAARLFYERLERLGQLIDVDFDTDLAALPPHVTHIRYPNGVVERVGFS